MSYLYAALIFIALLGCIGLFVVALVVFLLGLLERFLG